MYETIIEKIKEKLANRNLKVVIIPHISPDGDAAGSCSALWQVLDRVGITGTVDDMRLYSGLFKMVETYPGCYIFSESSERV